MTATPLALIGGVIWWLRKRALKVAAEFEAEIPADMPTRVALFWLAVGLVVLPVSSQFLVEGAVSIARMIGVSDAVLGKPDRHRGQALSRAGTGDAVAVLDPEQGAVGVAHEVAAVGVHEAVGLPVQRRAGVGADVGIAVDRLVLADHEDLAPFQALAEDEALAFPVLDVLEAAEKAAGVAHPSVSPRSQSRRQ